MDRSKLVRILPALALLTACGGGPRSGAGRPAEHPGHRPPTGLERAIIHSRGAMAYAAGRLDTALVSVELRERFALVVRSKGVATRSIDLGPADYDIVDLALDQTREQAWIASHDGTVRGYRVRDGQPVTSYNLGQRATSVALTGGYIATGSAAGVVCLRRRHDGALLQCVADHRATISSLSFSPKGDALISTAVDGSAVLWRVPTLAIAHRINLTGSINSARFSADGSRIGLALSGTPPTRSPELARRERAGTAKDDPGAGFATWTPGQTPRRCSAHRRPVVSLAWTGDGAHVLVGSWDRTVGLWRVDGCARIATLTGFTGIVRSISLPRGSGRATVAAWVSELDDPAVISVDILYASPRSH